MAKHSWKYQACKNVANSRMSGEVHTWVCEACGQRAQNYPMSDRFNKWRSDKVEVGPKVKGHCLSRVAELLEGLRGE